MRGVGVTIVLIVRIFATRWRTRSGCATAGVSTRKGNTRQAGITRLTRSTFVSLTPD